MRAVVTGVAGFIGSNLAEALVERGHSVVGIDCFTPYYAVSVKRANLTTLAAHPAVELVEADLRTADLGALLDGVDVVFHQAAQPGVRLSWAEHFSDYDSHNILATQRLLEAARHAGPRVVYASSSSVYGNADRYPTTEDDPQLPHSPYGVTKLAAETLCRVYAANFGVHTVSLRYFTVYGPRQRPDMAIHRLIESALTGKAFPLYGNGSQVRDFTFVADAVTANLDASVADVAPGTVVNVAGGSSTSMRDLIGLVERTVGSTIEIDRRAGEPGDVQQTGGSIDRAHRLLGWEPVVDIAHGVAAQAAWHRDVFRSIETHPISST